MAKTPSADAVMKRRGWVGEGWMEWMVPLWGRKEVTWGTETESGDFLSRSV